MTDPLPTTWSSTDELVALYHNVYIAHWECPTCRGRLVFNPASNVVDCRNCHRHLTLSPSTDPLRHSFRPYTDAERAAMIHLDRARQEPTCPIDASPMVVLAQRSLGLNSNVTIRCRRCRAEIAFIRKYG